MPAINPVKLLTAANATATNNSTTINITGDVDASRIFQGSVISIGGFTPVEAISGTLADVSGNSTITLRDPWPETTTTDRLTAFNTIEGLTGAIEKARQVVEQTSGIEEVSGTGLLEKTGENTYDVADFSTQGRNLVAGVDANAQRVTLGLGTAATEDVQSSPTDTTAGRLMPVGAFGLGEAGNANNQVEDDATQQPTGFYRDGDGSAFGQAVSVLNMRYNTNRQGQLGLTHGGGEARAFFRTMFSDNTWSDVNEFYHSGNSVNPLDYGIDIPTYVGNGFNIDTLFRSGIYRGYDGVHANASTGDNPFPDSGGTFVLEVFGRLFDSDDYCIQKASRIVGNVGEGVEPKERTYIVATGGWSPWREIYHSGNSVNPLDYGIGVDKSTSIGPLINNFDTNKYTGVFSTAGSEVGTPKSSTIASVLNLGRKNVNGISQLYLRGNEVDNSCHAYLRGGVGDTFTDWVEFFHSGNSANPTDYGIGGQGGVISGDDADNAVEGGSYRMTVSTTNSAFASTTTLIVTRSSNVVSQTQTDGFRVFVRKSTDTGATWTSWREIYHSGNTNFNEFGGGAGDNLAIGVVVSSTTIEFHLPINSTTSATGVTLSATGDFDVTTPSGVSVAASVTPSFSGRSSEKILTLQVTGLSSLTAGDIVYLRAKTATSKITVNF